ncbi:MAG TPA: xanthine dehydrogenase family protein subunit M [Pseudolabrys sp.]|jgi:carbon-monoxide dehydrogenase medium subunit|nr:xanthine dehydrogenase family protein subunit M [Pseudolabrys sp.]
MKPAAFEYVVADSVERAVAALADAQGEAKILAGGQSLVPMLNFRLLRPAILVDINRIPGLSFIEDAGDAVTIGALTRHHQLETSSVIAKHFPVLSCAMTHVAHLAIRNRGTIGGSLSHADPAAELPMMALLLDATLQIVSRKGRRVAAARDFFRDALTVDLAEDEMLTGIHLPKLSPQTGWGFEEVARRAGDFALAAVAATLTVSGGAVKEARIALTGVGPTALRVGEAEALLIGKKLDAALTARAIEAVRAAIMPETDLHASSDYRRHLAGVLTGRALAAAWRGAGAA